MVIVKLLTVMRLLHKSYTEEIEHPKDSKRRMRDPLFLWGIYTPGKTPQKTNTKRDSGSCLIQAVGLLWLTMNF